MRDAPKKLFMLALALAVVWSTIHFVSTKGLPPTWVHALEQGLDSATVGIIWHDKHRSPNEFALGRTDLSVLLGSQRKQKKTIDSLSSEVKDLEIRAIETSVQLRIAQQNQNAALVAQMTQTQAIAGGDKAV